jgi:hypothetical protein
VQRDLPDDRRALLSILFDNTLIGEDDAPAPKSMLLV